MKNKKEISYKGATNDLKQFIKEEFKGNNVIHFLVSENKTQRIEIEDKDTGEIWETLEALHPVNDMSNYDEISAVLINRFCQEIN